MLTPPKTFWRLFLMFVAASILSIEIAPSAKANLLDCVFSEGIPSGFSLSQPMKNCSELDQGNIVYVDFVLINSTRTIHLFDEASLKLSSSVIPIELLPQYLYSVGSVPSEALLHAAKSIGYNYKLKAKGLWLNGKIIVKSTDIISNPQLHPPSYTTNTSHPTTPPSSNGNSSSNSTAPSCSSFCDWDQSFSAITGSCNKIACPPWMSSSPYLTQEFWGLCGGCKTTYNAVCHNQWSCCNQWEYCRAGVGCTLPRYPKSCEKVSTCTSDSPGCFDGYLTSSECLIKTGAPSCVRVPSEQSTPINICEDFSYGLYCPYSTPSVDPILCWDDGMLSLECTRNALNGIRVNGNEGFCLQNSCNEFSSCLCSYVDLLYNSSYYGQQPVQTGEIKGLQFPKPQPVFKTTSPAENKFLVSYSDHVVTVISRTTDHFSVLLAKSGESKTTSCESSKCTISVPDSFYRSSGNMFVIISVDKGPEYHETIFILATIKCDKYIDNWDELWDTSCLTSQQIAIFSVTVSLLGIMILLVLVLLICLIISKISLWASRRREAELADAIVDDEGIRSQMLEDIKAWFNSAGRYIVTRGRSPASTAVVMLSLICVCQSQICGRTILEVSSHKVCEGETCTVLTTGDFELHGPGDSVCLNTNNSVIEISLTSQLDVLSFGSSYWTSDYDVVTESHRRCNYIDVCSESICNDVNLRGTRDANGNLDTQWTRNRPGQTSCDLICRNNFIGQDLWDCGCFLVKDNCMYCSVSFDPKGPVMKLSPVAGNKRESQFRMKVYWQNGTENEQYFSDSMIGTYSRITCESDSPSVDQLGLTDRCLVAVSGTSNLFLEPCSKRGLPQKGLLGDIQSTMADGLLNPTSESFIFSTDIMSQRTSTPDGCVWIRNVAPEPIDLLPRVITGQRWFNSSSNRIKSQSTFLTPTKCRFETSYVLASEQRSSTCPVVKSSTDVEGCANCNELPTLTFVSSSECGPGLASVSCESCTAVSPTVVKLGQELETYVLSLTFDSIKDDVEICLESLTKVCFSARSSVWYTRIDGANGNTTLVETNADQHWDDNSWNPFSWMKNVMNGIGKWWEWLLMVIFWIIVASVLLITIWFLWPFIFPVIKAIFTRVSDKVKAIRSSNDESNWPDEDPGSEMVEIDNEDKKTPLDMSLFDSSEPADVLEDNKPSVSYRPPGRNLYNMINGI
jgi:hypothetical protein